MKYKYLLIVLVLIGSFACKKDAYITDGGISKAETPFSTYDYLAGNKYHYFDTLLMIVDHFNLKDSVNKSGTFFAPTDYSIHRTMQALGVTTLDSLYTMINSRFLTQYMFSDTSMTLNNATTTVKTYKSWADSTAGLTKLASSYYVVNSSIPYYILEYVKINGVVDGSAGAPKNDPTDAVLQCQTTGIKTSTGTNLNVLSNNATLNVIGDPKGIQESVIFSSDIKQSDLEDNSVDFQLDSNKIAKFFGLTPAEIRSLTMASSDSFKYVAVEPTGLYNSTYTATAPGFWFGSDGGVVSWGDDAYLYGEYDVDKFILNVGQYPGHVEVGDMYTIKQAFKYTNSQGVLKIYNIAVYISIVQ